VFEIRIGLFQSARTGYSQTFHKPILRRRKSSLYTALTSTLNRLGVWATILKPDGPYIGRCELYPHVLPGGEMAAGEASLSFYIACKFWRRGLATRPQQHLFSLDVQKLP
jgi:RimJ/RimL family protein N-acetyltransferase